MVAKSDYDIVHYDIYVRTEEGSCLDTHQYTNPGKMTTTIVKIIYLQVNT